MQMIDKGSMTALIAGGLRRSNRAFQEGFGEEIAAVRINPAASSLMLEMASGRKFLIAINNA